MKIKISFIQLIQAWLIIMLLVFGGIIVTVDTINSYKDFHSRADAMRTNYIYKQKKMIKDMVGNVVESIRDKKKQSEMLIREKIQKMVYEAYFTVSNIYKDNQGVKNKNEIQKMILDFFRKIPLEGDDGYFFISSLDGNMIFHPLQKELMLKNHMNIRDARGKFLAKDVIQIIKQSKEGFYEYHWKKPNNLSYDFRKISFFKGFEPYGWVIGMGFYLDDIKEQIKKDLLLTISKIKFGKEGYIFIHKFNGDVLVSSRKVFYGRKKLWEIFNKNPEKIKKVSDKLAQVALNPDGEYIDYDWTKLTNLEQESPKYSFVFGLPDLQWLVGAGVYLDDVETEIALMQEKLNKQIKEKIFYSILIIIGVVCFFILILGRLKRKLRNDFNLFSSFFSRVVQFNEAIDRDKVNFIELDQVAENANKMLKYKIEAKQELIDEKEALYKSEEKFRSLVENSIDLIWEIDAQAKYTYVSPQLETILGYKVNEVIGKMPSDFMMPEYAEKMVEIFKNLKVSGKPLLTIESVFKHKDGRHIILETSRVPIVDGAGQVTGYRGIDRNITQRKNAEEELLKMQQLKSIGILAGGIAHDFNNILLGLYGNISFAKEEISKEHPAFESLLKAEKSMHRATSLTNQLLTFAKGGVPKKKIIRLDILIEEVVSFYLSGSNVKLHFEKVEGLLQAELDRGQIQQVFSNLATNAIQAMSEGGNLFVKLENIDLEVSDVLGLAEGKYIMITVRDDGNGIKKDYIDRIFDPYFTTKEKGTGLGLATTYSIVQKHGGSITVESKLGKGITFTLYLPASTALECEKEVLQLRAKNLNREGIHRALVMDDDKFICELTKKMLAISGFSVDIVFDGSQAIKAYRQAWDGGEPFEIVIMDLTIPGGMGGQDAVKEVLLINPDAKVIVSSGYSNDAIVANYQEYGFIASIAKPFKRSELMQIVDTIL